MKSPAKIFYWKYPLNSDRVFPFALGGGVEVLLEDVMRIAFEMDRDSRIGRCNHVAGVDARLAGATLKGVSAIWGLGGTAERPRQILARIWSKAVHKAFRGGNEVSG